MDEDKVIKENIQTPIIPLAKFIVDNCFTKEVKEKFCKWYIPIAIQEGRLMMEDLKGEMEGGGMDDMDESWDTLKDDPKAKIKNDAMLNTVSNAVRKNLDAVFDFANDIFKKEIINKIREELKK